MLQFAREPYRLFFPIGILYGVWGGLIWVAFATGWTQSYPGSLHSQIMIGGFLGSFAFGFLMTAIPKFTRTFPPNTVELGVVALPLVSLPLMALAQTSIAVSLALLTSLVGLMAFAARRFLHRSASPPPSFVFLGLGLFSAFAGILLEVLSHLSEFSPDVKAFGRTLYLQCFMLSLVIGVGCRLIPALLGWGPAPIHEGKLQDLPTGNRVLFVSLAVSFFFSFVVEIFLSQVIGRLLRTAIITFIAHRFWIIHKLPLSRSKVAWGLWASCWMTLIGVAGSSFFPGYSLHFLHLAFIGGLGLTTLMIAARVVIAHGGFSLALESTLSSLSMIPILLILAALTRLAVVYAGIHYLSTLALASILWSMALLLWGATIGRRIGGEKISRS